MEFTGKNSDLMLTEWIFCMEFHGLFHGIYWEYPLVNIQKTMELSTIFKFGKSTNYKWAIFQFALLQITRGYL